MSETEKMSSTLEEVKSSQSVKAPPGKAPFRIWFSLTREMGRSNLSTASPLGLVPGVTGKFYSPRETCCEGVPDVESVKKIYDSGPKQKFLEHPPLESHKYGWYSDIRFANAECLKDRTLNYHKRTLEMFRTPTFVKKS